MGLGPSQQLPSNQPLLPHPSESGNLSQVTATATLHSDSSIDRNSFQLKPSEEGGDLYYLDFTYNSHEDCLISVYYFCTEVIELGSRKKTFVTDEAKFPKKVEMVLTKGYHQPVPHGMIGVDVGQHLELLTFQEPAIIPLVVEISLQRDAAVTVQSHTSFLCFSQDSGVWKPKLLQQRLYTQGRYFILHEFFGVQRQNHPDEESSECVVCMTDRRNTAVLPCRHMCLCTNCANIVRSQPSSKCPICRSQVDSLMQLIVEADE